MDKLRRSLAIKMETEDKLKFSIVNETVFWQEMEMLISIKQMLANLAS